MSQYFKGCFTFIKTADLLHLRFRPPPDINVTEDYIVLVKENRLGNFFFFFSNVYIYEHFLLNCVGIQTAECVFELKCAGIFIITVSIMVCLSFN